MNTEEKPLDKDKWQFVLEQGYRWMDGQIGAFDAVTSKAAGLLGIVLALIPALAGVATTAGHQSRLFVPTLVLLAFLGLSGALLVACVVLRKIVFSGRVVEHYLVPEVFSHDLHDIIVEECLECQNNIVRNQDRLNLVTTLYGSAVMALVVGVGLASLAVVSSSPLLPLDGRERNAGALRETQAAQGVLP